MKKLTDLRMGGVSPFVSYGDTVNDCLRQSRALLIIIEAGFRAESDLQALPKGDTIEVLATLNPTIKADAIEGIQSLLALAQYCQDMAADDRKAPQGLAVAA